MKLQGKALGCGRKDARLARRDRLQKRERREKNRKRGIWKREDGIAILK